MSKNAKCAALLEESAQLHEKMAETLRDLRRCIMIADLIDMPVGQIKGKISTGVRQTGTGHIPLYSRPWLSSEFIVRIDGEQVFCRPMAEVPVELWPDNLRDEYVKRLKIRKEKINAR